MVPREVRTEALKSDRPSQPLQEGRQSDNRAESLAEHLTGLRAWQRISQRAGVSSNSLSTCGQPEIYFSKFPSISLLLHGVKDHQMLPQSVQDIFKAFSLSFTVHMELTVGDCSSFQEVDGHPQSSRNWSSREGPCDLLLGEMP